MKLIKSKSQVYGSYVRDNQLIGDIDILIDEKQKDKCLYNIYNNINKNTKSKNKQEL